jgi:hypothetical protein
MEVRLIAMTFTPNDCKVGLLIWLRIRELPKNIVAIICERLVLKFRQ